MKKRNLLLIIGFVFLLVMTGCSGSESESTQAEQVETQDNEETFTYGTTAYGTAMQNTGVNPQQAYSGWSAVRYGVGETLFRLNDELKVESWLAEDFEKIDAHTMKISLKDGLTFSNGEQVDGQAVKESLESLVANHERAKDDLQIESIETAGNELTIHTKNNNAILINHLCDPYTSIIDTNADTGDDKVVIGTGPYAVEQVSNTEIQLVRNENYWTSKPSVKNVHILSIPDGDTLTMLLQNGSVDAAQGLPYENLELFKEPNYKKSQTPTSRVYQVSMNYDSNVLQNQNVRQAITESFDKEAFSNVLLNGNGVPANSPFLENMSDQEYETAGYDPEHAKELLAEAGWADTNGDQVVDKNRENLSLKLLTYSSRQELPVLAEYMKNSLREIGIDLQIVVTDNYQQDLESGDFDLFANAFVTAPTGNTDYYMNSHYRTDGNENVSGYNNEQVDEYLDQLSHTSDKEDREELTGNVVQAVLDDHAYLYTSHLKMTTVMKSNVKGFNAHPSDYYEITNDLSME